MMAAQFPYADLDAIFTAARDGNISAQRALEDAGELLLASARIGLRRHALDTVALTPVLGSLLGGRASLVGAVLVAAESTELVVDID